MPTIGVFYGSTSGNTKHAAELIAKRLGPECQGVFNIRDVPVSHMQHFDRLFIGCPTYNTGELQDDWDMQFGELKKLSWAGKKIALFAFGDMNGYPSTFMDAMGILYSNLTSLGAQNMGLWRTDGYTFDQSKAVVDGYFVGLPLDESQQDQTEARVHAWVDYVKPHMVG
jgi:flavodoxin I